MYLRVPAVLEIEVRFERDFLIKDYTAKLVKTLLISCCRDLEQIFDRPPSFPPKPVSISPLYIEVGGKIRAVYAKKVLGEEQKGLPPAEEIPPARIEGGKPYKFYLRAPMEIAARVAQSLPDAVGKVFTFGRTRVAIADIAYRVTQVDVEKEVEETLNALRKSDRVKVVFMSPAKLKNPYVYRWAAKKKKGFFLPTPSSVFSIPLYMALADSGLLRESLYRRLIRYIDTVLDTPYTYLKTAKIAAYVYDGSTKPALIGYVKYFVDREAIDRAEVLLEYKLKHSPLNILAKTITAARIYGIGNGRAAGFGHTRIQSTVSCFPL